jgi:hypothetical protein
MWLVFVLCLFSYGHRWQRCYKHIKCILSFDALLVVGIFVYVPYVVNMFQLVLLMLIRLWKIHLFVCNTVGQIGNSFVLRLSVVCVNFFDNVLVSVKVVDWMLRFVFMVSNFGIFTYMFLISNERVWVFLLMSIFGRSVIKWMELWMLYVHQRWRPCVAQSV